MPFAFLFPPPSGDPQKLRYKDAPPGAPASKVFLVNRPPTKPGEDEAIAAAMAEGCYLLGICAHQEWPRRLANPHDSDAARTFDLFSTPYYRRFVGFLHHLREPRDVFPDDGLPLLSMDFSDFVQVRKRGVEKRYDLLYYGGLAAAADGRDVSAWSAAVKQHDLARSVVRAVLAAEPDARICLVQADLGIDDPRVTRCGLLGYREFLDEVEASRIVLVASEVDASPRILTEALCLDAWVMVNERISGGWKYVCPETGAFFGRDGAVDVFRRLRAWGPARTRAWFLRNYPNHVLEARFDAWLNQAIVDHCAFNRFGRVFALDVGGGVRRIEQELFGFMEVYGDCVERTPAEPSPGSTERGRVLAHLAALRRARDRGLPDVAILEDGFGFLAHRRVASRKLEAMWSAFPEWDLIFFGRRGVGQDEPTREAGVRRVLSGALPRGYAVRARCYDRLVAALEKAAEEPEGATTTGGDLLGGAAGASVYTFQTPLGE